MYSYIFDLRPPTSFISTPGVSRLSVDLRGPDNREGSEQTVREESRLHIMRLDDVLVKTIRSGHLVQVGCMQAIEGDWSEGKAGSKRGYSGKRESIYVG